MPPRGCRPWAGQLLIGMAPRHPARRATEALLLAEAGATPALPVPTPGYAMLCALVSAGRLGLTGGPPVRPDGR
ncbi:hypothetical protein AB0L75_11280 [Streptomyces sp. NPDC052101]|uniref:hypothetical protein n=1 Tax=Streptomyces sp. NPDC052101 TaxID=3155763 RepID=UPI00341B2E9E